MSLKLRLNLVITLLILSLFIAGSAFLVRAARTDVRAEITSTANLAMHFLDAELRRAAFAQTNRPEFDLASLGQVRHLRIELYDPAGTLLESNHPAGAPAPAAPRWFARLVGAVSADAGDIRRGVLVDGSQIAELVVRPDPTFEVDEIWQDATSLMQLAVLIFIATNGLIYWVVGRALSPVDKILAALKELEKGNLTTRLPPLALPELSRIGSAFNRMMDTLQASVTQNRQLAQQLIRVQEEERRSLSRELHDELGQCLTAIHADGVAILNAAKAGRPVPSESATAVVAVTRQIMDLVRGMLRRLHPETLDSLGLDEALHELVNAWRQRNPEVTCELHVTASLEGLGDTQSISVYRVVQEALTNVSRHAHAGHVEVRVRRAGTLTVEVEDDGTGMDTDAQTRGFGLPGMRERVEALGGTLHLSSGGGRGGVTLSVELPLMDASRHP
jgi:two-component system sensor histidine kinase UhpB